MNIVQTYRTESDWCALVAHQDWRQTLTYATEPDEAQVLADAEYAYAASMADAFPAPLAVDETATIDDKRDIIRGQVISAAALAGTESALLPVQAALDAVAEGLTDGD